MEFENKTKTKTKDSNVYQTKIHNHFINYTNTTHNQN